ncbi:MAG: hypothetical protein ACFFD8_00940 [Candidatus Thorarchaeota archaeon]
MSFGLDQYFKKEKASKKSKEDTKEESPVKMIDTDTSGDRDWQAILEATVESMVLYPHLLDYTRTNILPNQKSITPEELAIQLRIPLGVAIVLLDKLQHESKE